MSIRVGTFNTLNLASAGQTVYGEVAYDTDDYEQKVAWMGRQLARMDCDVVGFQEVWSLDALKDVAVASGLYTPEQVFLPSGDGGPHLALASRLPIREVPSEVEFPKSAQVVADGVPVPFLNFQRAPLRAVVELPSGAEMTVFNAHLKSKRPLFKGIPEDTPGGYVLGQAQALILRAVEAAGLRHVLNAEMRDNHRPTVLIGDLNDDVGAVTNDMIDGKSWPADDSLHSVHTIHASQSTRDFGYTYIYYGNYSILDHLYVSQEFVPEVGREPEAIGRVRYVEYLNDHVVDEQQSGREGDPLKSDHAQVVAWLDLF